MTTPTADEATLRAELEQVRHEMLEGIGADVLSGRELLIGFGLGVPAIVFGLLFVAIGVSPAPGRERDVVALGLGVALLALAAFLLRPYAQRRVREVGRYRRLRQRERELVAALPAGTTGTASGWQYVARFFGGAPIAVLLLVTLLIVAVAVLAF